MAKKEKEINKTGTVGKIEPFGLFDLVIHLILIFFCVICIVPLLNTVAISLSDKSSAAAGHVLLWPVNFTVQPYIEIVKDAQYIRSFGISVLRVILGTIINVGFSISMAYPLSKSRQMFHMRDLYMWIMIFTMMFGGGLVATYIWIKNLGLLDTIWVLVLPGAVPTFSVIVLMNFFKGLPNALEEAALVDGASPWQIMYKIFVPLSLPSLATISLFAIVGHWNSYFDGKIYINSLKNLPLQTYIQALTSEITAEQMVNMSPEEIIARLEVSSLTFNCAKVVICTIPVLVIYPFLQKYFVTGLVMGSVKE